MSIKDRQTYGVFSLKKTLINVREANATKLRENRDAVHLKKIIGLDEKETYATKESLKKLRYGKLLIMADRVEGGAQFKGLLLSFVHHEWPMLIKHGFVEQVRKLFLFSFS